MPARNWNESLFLEICKRSYDCLWLHPTAKDLTSIYNGCQASHLSEWQ
jgi:hypothetical protein